MRAGVACERVKVKGGQAVSKRSAGYGGDTYREYKQRTRASVLGSDVDFSTRLSPCLIRTVLSPFNSVGHLLQTLR